MMKTEENSFKNLYRGIETDKGVLLFDTTKEGSEQFHKTMALFLDNLYNPACDITYFNIHFLECRDDALKNKCIASSDLIMVFPVSENFYTDKDVLQYSNHADKFSWDAAPSTVNKLINIQVDDDFLPVSKQTMTISALQEIARGDEYYLNTLSRGNTGWFLYDKELYNLADTAISYSGHIHEGHVLAAMREKAEKILERDYPDIRKSGQVAGICKSTVPRKVSVPPKRQSSPLKKKNRLGI